MNLAPTSSYSMRVFAATCVILFFLGASQVVHGAYVATTTVSLTVCGDGIIAGTEFCDDGPNTGYYANSIAGRNCKPDCEGYGPYCGDYVTNFVYDEECDDGNNTAGDLCDMVCQNESEPVTEGGGSGGGTPGGGGGKSSGLPSRGVQGASVEGGIEFEGETNVTIRGTAYPSATVTILKDGEVVRVVEADSSGDFEMSLVDQTPGITTYGFWALDRANRRSITYAATFQVVQNAMTTLAGILIPPTLTVTPDRTAPGGTVAFEGSAAPDSELYAFVDSQEDPERAAVLGSGAWSIAYGTATLTPETTHTVRAQYIRKQSELKSGFSQLVTFFVGNGTPSDGVTADLNKDGAIDLTDFSILLFNWNTNTASSDINGDGVVSLPDFSIMLFNWTG